MKNFLFNKGYCKMVATLLYLIILTSCHKETNSGIASTTNVVSLAILSTVVVTNITDTTAVSGGTITFAGGTSELVHGICWTTSENPTIANSKTVDGKGTGTYTSSLSGLIGNTMYHLRAYATNAAGTAYGNDVSFTSKRSIFIPVLTTIPATSITQTTATSGGDISSDGGSAVTARGVCWSPLINPTTGTLKTLDGAGAGTFTSNFSGLLPNTIYYVRAYATNRIGTAYGGNISITTTSTIPGFPSIKTLPAFYLPGFTTIRCGGKITSDGGYSITARGICWSETVILPTLSSFYRTSTEVSDSFHVLPIGIPIHTTFYIRAFATNSIGTSYGNVVIFSRQ